MRKKPKRKVHIKSVPIVQSDSCYSPWVPTTDKPAADILSKILLKGP